MVYHSTIYAFRYESIALYINIPVNTKHLYNIYTMLDQCQRRLVDVV